MRSESRAQTSPPHSSRKVASISRYCHAVLVLAKDGCLVDSVKTCGWFNSVTLCFLEEFSESCFDIAPENIVFVSLVHEFAFTLGVENSSRLCDAIKGSTACVQTGVSAKRMLSPLTLVRPIPSAWRPRRLPRGGVIPSPGQR
jgi:hypothetical protein